MVSIFDLSAHFQLSFPGFHDDGVFHEVDVRFHLHDALVVGVLESDLLSFFKKILGILAVLHTVAHLLLDVFVFLLLLFLQLEHPYRLLLKLGLLGFDDRDLLLGQEEVIPDKLLVQPPHAVWLREKLVIVEGAQILDEIRILLLSLLLESFGSCKCLILIFVKMCLCIGNCRVVLILH